MWANGLSNRSSLAELLTGGFDPKPRRPSGFRSEAPWPHGLLIQSSLAKLGFKLEPPGQMAGGHNPGVPVRII